MLISKNWLKDFVNVSENSEDLATYLTMKTVEVESVKVLSKDLDNIIVGKICSVEDHPDADNLKVCEVSIGKEDKKNKSAKIVRVVCGGSNLQKDMLVAFGNVGAKVRWHGEGELVELSKVKIRGVESSGMICASDEIGLENMFPKKSEKEILDLSFLDAPAGTSLADALDLDDVVFDIDNKSMTHRADLWGHYGIAREISAFTKNKLKVIKAAKIKRGKSVDLSVKVIDKNLCPRYVGLVIEGIKIEPSPAWMQKRLLAVGVRSINNIVDITNYVMHELGQPMHAFDSDKVFSGDKKTENNKNKKTIVVRKAKGGEKFTTLGGKEYDLSAETLVIADNSRAIAIAGVKGGKNSEIDEDTTSIILESANFNASNVRQTSIALGLRTDSSSRFEKSLDPEGAMLAMQRAVELILAIVPNARVASSLVDENNFKSSRKPIALPLDLIDKKLGIQIPKKDSIQILKRLGFAVNTKNEELLVVPPSWRSAKDISIPEDLVEEIVRMYGYDLIPSSLPNLPITPPEINKTRFVERKLKELLAYEFGFTEVYNYSFVSKDLLKKMGENLDNYLELDNPIAKDRPMIRRHIIANMLQNVESNLHRYDEVGLFEIGKTYIIEEAGDRVKFGSGELLPKQELVLGMAYAQKDINIPFYILSEAMIGTLNRLNIDVKLRNALPKNNNWVHGGRFAEIYFDNSAVGFISELNPSVQENLGIPYRTAVLELKVEALAPFFDKEVDYEKLPNYPSVDRDLAFLVNREVEHEKIVEAVRKIDLLVADVELFDVYEGKQIEKGKKSMAYHIIYRSEVKTLESKDVDGLHLKVIDLLQKKFGAEIRK